MPRPPRPGQRDARGFTLTEVMVVIVLAGVVTLGLLTFYLNSQAMWIDASTQAMAQRDATMIVELMREKAQRSANALVTGGNAVTFYDSSNQETDQFSWNPADSLVYHRQGATGTPERVVPTIVEYFVVRLDPTPGVVDLDTLQVRSTSGQRIMLASAFGLYNQ